jgi:alcohol dehydrogenase class IV
MDAHSNDFTECGVVSRVGTYDLTIPPSIRFGWGRLQELPEVVLGLGKRLLLVVGRTSFIASGAERIICQALTEAAIDWKVVATSTSEPTVAEVAAAARGIAAEDLSDAVVVAIGGGATIDLAKAAAALAANIDARHLPQDQDDWEVTVVDHLEGVGRQLPIRCAPPPLVAIPTTAGTGAEATRNAVISCPRRGFKKSMRSPLMVPRAVIVDPQLTRSAPARVTAASGLDAITQLIESYVSRAATSVTRPLAASALAGAMRALPVVVQTAGADDPVGEHERAAREAMCHASLLSGIALANSGLGMAHGVAPALGIACGASHGEACAVMLPAAVRVNLEQEASSYAELERRMHAAAPREDHAAAAAFLERVEKLCDAVGVPRRLSELGVEPSMIRWLAEHSGGNSMRGNPVPMTPETLTPVLESLL